MAAAIVAGEVGFWVLLVGGLLLRYGLRARRSSTVVLAAVPLVDVAVLVVAGADLLGGAAPGTGHSIAAIYLGASVAFGPQLIRWADGWFATRFAGALPRPRPARYGREHAARERRGWLGHLAAYLLAAAILGLFTALAGGLPRAAPLWSAMGPWTVVLVIDFLISFSYTLAPRRPRQQ
jgi:hypothetical protein